ncbi:MAG: NAD(P)-dependent oxidoreductase [Caulobacteraceae bacterium]|nr:NAD(P)-dependent oxidoreductase [Caulobacteraceae bacterium]
MKAAVFGAGGFIGRHLTDYLRGQGWEVLALGRGDEAWRGRDLGHVFYCIGLTADFRTRPFETVEAHVTFAAEVLRKARYDSFLYCSSTRVYAGADRATETARLSVSSADPSDLYNLSKLTGEAICLAAPGATRVARLSNVFGPGDASDNFLASLMRDAVTQGRVILRSQTDSEKDYVAVEDVVVALARIATDGTEPIYNVAAGRNTSHGRILAAISRASGCAIQIEPVGPAQVFPVIDVSNLRNLGSWRPVDVMDRVGGLMSQASFVRNVE